ALLLRRPAGEFRWKGPRFLQAGLVAVVAGAVLARAVSDPTFSLCRIQSAGICLVAVRPACWPREPGIVAAAQRILWAVLESDRLDVFVGHRAVGLCGACRRPDREAERKASLEHGREGQWIHRQSARA